MISYDKLVIDFITQNYLTLTIAFTLLKGVAKVTPWAWDDSIVSLFFGVFKGLRPGNDVGTESHS